MSQLWRLLFLVGAAYSVYVVFSGLRGGSIASRFRVSVDRAEDPLMFWVVALIWSLTSLALLLLFVLPN